MTGERPECWYRYAQNVLGACEGAPTKQDRFGYYYCPAHWWADRQREQEEDQ